MAENQIPQPSILSIVTMIGILHMYISINSQEHLLFIHSLIHSFHPFFKTT